MSKLAQLRAQIGPAADSLTDQELFEVVQEVYTPLGADPKRLQQQYGYDPEWDFGRGLRIAGRNTLAAGAGALAAGADALGFTGARDNLLTYGRGQQQQAYQLGRRSDDVDNFADDPLSFLSAGAGQAVGYAAPSILGGGVGAGAARLAGMRALGGAAAGSYAVNLGQETGGIYNELAEQGRFEPGRALAYGAGAAALDTAAEAVPFLRAAPKGGLLRRVATGGLTQAGVEAGTETAQTAIERAGAYKDLTSPEAWHEYRNAAALGALGGGMFGGGMAAFPSADARSQPVPTVDPAPGEQTDLLQISKGFDARAPLADFTPAGPRPGSRVLQMPPESLAGEPEWGLSQGARDPVDAMPAVGEAADLFRMPMDGRFPVASGYDPRLAGLFTGPMQPGQTLGDRFTTPLTVPDMPAVGTPVTADPLGVNVQGEYGDMFNRTQTADPDRLRGALTPAEDPGLALARQRYEEQIRAAEAKREQQAAIRAAAEKFAAKRTAATEALIEPNADGSSPIKLKEREITTHSKLAELRDAGTITPEQYTEYAGRMREALKNNDRRVLGRVAKEVAELEGARVTSPGATGGTGTADLGRGAADQRAPGQPGSVRPTGAQPAAQAMAGERPGGVRPGVAGGDDALTGPNLAGKFVERVQQLDPESQAYLSRWLGVEMDGDGRLTLREDGAESLRTMADTLGVSHETVRERVRKALRQMGLPETVQAQELYEDLGLSAAGTDIDTVNRMTQGEPESEPATDALDAVEEVADDTALGGVGDTQVRATPAARRGPARVGDDQDAPLLTERPDDDPTGRVREAAGPIDEGSLAAEDRIDEARGLTLDDALETDVSTGRVVADDIDEARYFYEQNRQRGMQPWNRLSVIDQATAVRLYARARLAGDPLVLATKKALYEDAQRTDGRRGSAADTGAARDATGGPADGGDAAADAGNAGDQSAQYQVPAARGSVPVVTKRKRRVVRTEPDEDVTWGDQLQASKASTDPAATYHDADSLTDSLLTFMNADALGRRVTVVDTANDLDAVEDLQASRDGSAVAWARDGRAYLIADRIRVGTERGVFMHEVGGHLGLERMLKPEEFSRLVGRIVSWAAKDGDAVEVRLAKLATARVEQAGTKGAEARNAEVVAYFIEEAVNAGVDPTAMKFDTELNRWMRSLWAAFKVALRKLGVSVDKLTAQDIVDLAYGAARLNITGRFHGTAAKVRQFRTKYIGTGEGAQAYGWGLYFSELRGVAEDYKKSDVQRKAGTTTGEPSLGELAKKLTAQGFPAWDGGIYTSNNHPDAKLGVSAKSPVRPSSGGILHVRVESKLKYNRDTRAWENTKEKPWVAIDTLDRPNGKPLFSDEHLAAMLEAWKAKKPVQGNLYATDIAVRPDEFLDWTKPVDDQSSLVKERLNMLFPQMFDPDTYGAEYFRKMTGGQAYRDLEVWFEEAQAGELEGRAEVQAFADKNPDMRPAELASRYLDSIGIKGVRMPVNYQRGGTYTEGRNFVVFNEKNVVRAVENPENRVSKSVQFSKAPGEASKAQADLEAARKAIRDRMPPPAQDALTNIGDAFRKYSPYLLSSFQLMEQFGDKIKALAKHLKITDLMVQESTRQQMAYDAIAKRWEGLPTAARELLNTVARTATLRGMHPDRAFDAEGNKHLKPEARTEHARLRAEYQRMERTFPAAAQVYQDALKQLEASWDAQEKAIEQLYEKYGVKRPELKKVPGPYFPLMRFGEYLATAKSAEFMELEDQLRMTDDPTTRAEAMKILAEMKRDPKHYVVSAHETRAAQERALRKLQEQGSFQEVRAGMASQRLESMPRDIHATITDLTAAMGKHFDPDSVKMIEQSLSQMLLRTLPEAHALERQAQRAGVEGATTDMLRAFAAAGRQNAFYTARTLHAKDLAANMEAMKGEVRGNVDLMHVHREIEKRVALDLRFRDTPIQNWLSTVSWIYNLGVSPTFLAMNALQPALVTFPTLAAKYGAGTASRELSRAWKEALQVLKDARFKDGKWDAWAGINEQSVQTTRKNAEGVSEDRKALRELMQRGIVDEGLVHDMGRLADGQTGMVERVAKYTGWASQQIELANRVSTALATFRLARTKGLDYDAAVEEAYRSTVKTQIDYSAEGAPRFMREGGGIPLAKLIFQFRRYQQGMLYLLGSNIQKAFGRGAEASEARAVLGYFAVVSGLAAGALGMPLAGAVMWALNAMFPDDDEEGDAETRFRNLLFDLTGDQKMATVLAKGLPALWGMDLSARIGMGDVAAPLPRLEMAGATTAEDRIGRLLTNIAGPVAGLGVRAYDAATYWSQGDMLKGTERALPKAAGDVIQSYRLATQGMTDRKGEQILGADELDAWDKLYRGLGTTPTVQSNYYEATGAKRQVEQAINDRKSRIRVEFRNALRDGDMSDVRELIDDFNRDHPDAKIKPKDEVAWRREAGKAEAQRGPDGIKVNPKRDQRYEELMRFARG